VGSGAFIAYTDTQIYLVEGDNPGDPRTLGWTPRCGQAEQWQFQFDQATKLFVPYEGLQDEGPTEATDRPTQLLKLIPDDGIDRGDLEEIGMDQLKCSRSSIHRALVKLKQNRLILWDERGHIQRRKPS
jgi:hypothetical protein